MKRIFLSLFVFLFILAPASFAATNAQDPAGDNCTDVGCGPDLLGVSDRVDADGTVHFTVQRSGLTCQSLAPSGNVNPSIRLMSASATDASQEGLNTAFVWTVSNTNQYLWSPPNSTGSDDEVQLTSTQTAGMIEVAVPKALIDSIGGLPLKYYVRNSCKDHWSEPEQWRTKDIAPNSGVYTLEAAAADQCPNIAGDQASVPAGYFKDAAGSCIQDQCPNIAGGQESVPAGYFKDAFGNCMQDQCPNLAGGQNPIPAGYVKDAAGNCQLVTLSGTAFANTIIGSSVANIINGFGGNDTLWGRGGADKIYGGLGLDKLYGEIGNDKLFGDAGADLLKGGAGIDTLAGGAGKDKLYGDAGNDVLNANDKASGDVLYGGMGTDTCYYNAGDILYSCEKKIRK